MPVDREQALALLRDLELRRQLRAEHAQLAELLGPAEPGQNTPSCQARDLMTEWYGYDQGLISILVHYPADVDGDHLDANEFDPNPDDMITRSDLTRAGDDGYHIRESTVPGYTFEVAIIPVGEWSWLPPELLWWHPVR
jgi:hypothetical protein